MSKVIVTIAGQEFKAEISDHRITQSGFETSFGVDLKFDPEDQRRLNYALGDWAEDRSDIEFRSVES